MHISSLKPDSFNVCLLIEEETIYSLIRSYSDINRSAVVIHIVLFLYK